VLCAATLAGCTASRVPFHYTAAYVPADRPLWKRATILVIDERSDKSLDEALTIAVDRAVGEALVAEARSSSIASEVSYSTYSPPTPHAQSLQQGIDVEVVARVKELRWEIVNYDALQATAFAVGLLTGLIGAAVMAATKTDVDGHATVDIQWIDLRSGRSFDRTYVGHCQREWPMLASDQAEAKAKMSACALENALRGLRTDLELFAARP
jgi:hypothetical protein